MWSMRALLVSTYDLGRQPFGVASAAAWLRRAGCDVVCVDVSRQPLDDAVVATATLVAFYLPMHTATRLAAPLIDRVREVNPAARLCAYGLYAPLNDTWLRERGVTHVLGPEAEEDLVALANSQLPPANYQGSLLPRLAFIQPDRSGLPPLDQYATLQMPDGTRRLAGSTEATRGCKHLCRHCPIVPVYEGQFRVVPIDVVLDDIRSQVAAGAQHITFGDPDFFNGPAHARRIVERLAVEFPDLTYDVTIKIEHLLQHADLVPLLRATGCLFVTSAVESVDDAVLELLRKGHTRADFLAALALCREAGLALVPTFVPFTPWTTIEGYLELLDTIDELELVEQVSPVQLGIRLLITARSPLLELADIASVIDPFDAASLSWPWVHRDPRVDALQRDVMRLVAASTHAPRSQTFTAIAGLTGRERAERLERYERAPMLSEPWYCCAEPLEAL